MYIVSFNIIYKEESRKIILTESPYLFVNDNLKIIMTEIRKIVKEDFIKIADEMQLISTKLAIGMTTLTISEESYMHFFDIDVANIKDFQYALLGI